MGWYCSVLNFTAGYTHERHLLAAVVNTLNVHHVLLRSSV
jgi:hypothetical protein